MPSNAPDPTAPAATGDPVVTPGPVATLEDAADRRRARELAGIDALDTYHEPPGATVQRLWAATWPKLAAVVIFLGLWQGVAWSGFRPAYLLPGPLPVLQRLGTSAAGITRVARHGGVALPSIVGADVEETSWMTPWSRGCARSG